MKKDFTTFVKASVLLALITGISAQAATAQTPVLVSTNQDGSNLCSN